MEALVPSVSSSLLLPTLPNSNHTLLKIVSTKSHLLTSRKRCTHLKGNRRISTTRIPAISDVSAVTSPAGVELTWQIVVGALAGVTPFVVAGIEFSKRIMAQRKCEVCGGSGLVLRDNKYYFRCPGCGGFLPWQSWKRFFSG